MSKKNNWFIHALRSPYCLYWWNVTPHKRCQKMDETQETKCKETFSMSETFRFWCVHLYFKVQTNWCSHVNTKDISYINRSISSNTFIFNTFSIHFIYKANLWTKSIQMKNVLIPKIIAFFLFSVAKALQMSIIASFSLQIMANTDRVELKEFI